jgi:class 3 adenylate cyclase
MTAGAQIAVLFLTDVEGSSQLWQQHGNKLAAVLDQLDAIMEEVIAAYGGEFDRERGHGESHLVAFKQATAATRAAAELQRRIASVEWPHAILPRLRIGLHAGEVERRGHELAGSAMNRAVRLRSVAHGGQIVGSRALVELVAGELDGGLEWSNLGVHRVRDVPGWTEIFQLCAPFLQREFPPLVTLDSGLPPISAIVFLDVVGRTATQRSHDGENTLFNLFSELFAGSFTSARGQYLQFLGDGCLAIFADTQAALRFAREAREGAHALELELRAALHLGRVEFAFGAPYGRSVRIAGALMRHAAPGKITLTPAAAALTEAADDIVVREPQA